MKGLALATLLVVPMAANAQQKVALPARDKIIPEKATQIYQIGAEDGEDWELLSGARAVAFDARDNMYVLDTNNYRVLMFDATGKFVRQISKQGGGPGELQSPTGMTVAADGSIVVSDLGRRGYSIFKSDGTFVKNVLFEEGFMTGGVEAHPRSGVVSRSNMTLNFGRGGGAPGTAARGVARGGGAGAMNIEGVGGPTGERKSPVMWYDLNTGKASRLHEFTLPSITPKVVDQGGNGEQRRVMVAISPPVWQMDVYMGMLPSGGLAYVTEKDYRVHVTNASGQVERIIERPIASKKATEKDKEMAMERRRENIRNNTGGIRVSNVNGRQSFSTGGGGPREVPSLESLLKDATFEEFIPALRQIRTDAAGRIWLQRTAADHGQTGPIDLIRADGTYIGTLASGRLPDAVSRTGRAAWIERDDLGVEHVVVRRLPASWQ